MRLMRLEEVCGIAGIGKTSVYKLINEGAFPKPVSIGGRAVRWVSTEIQSWILERVEERDGRRLPALLDDVGGFVGSRGS